MKQLKKKIKILVFSSIVFILLVVFLFFFFLFNPGLITHVEPGPRDSLSLEEQKKIQEGDIILIRGQGLASDMIIMATSWEMEISHCGFIVMRDEIPWVIHTVSPSLSGIDGVRWHSLKEFNEHATVSTIVIVRPRWSEGEAGLKERKTAVERALYYLEQEVPFDHLYDSTSADKLYCNELLIQILKDAGFSNEELPIEMRGPLISFKTFLNPDFFEIIINHQEDVKE
jgi:hypothetical protein